VPKQRRADGRPDEANSRFSQCSAKTSTSLREKKSGILDDYVRHYWNSLDRKKINLVGLYEGYQGRY